MTEFTSAEMVGCIERELKMRRRVYPRWVSTGKMSQPQANREIALMEAILARLQTDASTERLL
jgi:hypothetical protein